MAVLRLEWDYLYGRFKARMLIFGWPLKGWDETFWGGCFKVGMHLFGWQFYG